jgi:hypothetical protein
VYINIQKIITKNKEDVIILTPKQLMGKNMLGPFDKFFPGWHFQALAPVKIKILSRVMSLKL